MGAGPITRILAVIGAMWLTLWLVWVILNIAGIAPEPLSLR